MKTVLTLLTLFTLVSFNASPEDPSQWGLPHGVKLRLGKGMISSQIQYSPDGARLAVGSGIGIWLYDTTTYQEIALLTGHSGGISSVAFSSDGSTLASASWDKTIRLWDAVTGAHLRTLEGHTSNVGSVAFNREGSILASASWDKTIRLWDT